MNQIYIGTWIDEGVKKYGVDHINPSNYNYTNPFFTIDQLFDYLLKAIKIDPKIEIINETPSRKRSIFNNVSPLEQEDFSMITSSLSKLGSKVA